MQTAHGRHWGLNCRGGWRARCRHLTSRARSCLGPCLLAQLMVIKQSSCMCLVLGVSDSINAPVVGAAVHQVSDHKGGRLLGVAVHPLPRWPASQHQFRLDGRLKGAAAVCGPVLEAVLWSGARPAATGDAVACRQSARTLCSVCKALTPCQLGKLISQTLQHGHVAQSAG